MFDYLVALEGPFWSVVVIVAAVIVGLLAHCVLVRLMSRAVHRHALHDSIIGHLCAPLRVLSPLLAVQLSLPLEHVNLSDATIDFLHLMLSTALILTSAENFPMGLPT